jgi:hypothetical protein
VRLTALIFLASLLPQTALAEDQCHHGVVCVKQPGLDMLLEARAGYAFFGTAEGLSLEATAGFGNLGLGLPRNILFIGEFGFTGGKENSELSDAKGYDTDETRVRAFDVSAGVRAYWPTRGSLTAFADVLFGAANHRVDAAQEHPWTFMGQLALGMELHLFQQLYLVGRAKAAFFGPGGVLFVAAVADGNPNYPHHAHYRHEGELEIEAVRLSGTLGLNWCF